MGSLEGKLSQIGDVVILTTANNLLAAMNKKINEDLAVKLELKMSYLSKYEVVDDLRKMINPELLGENGSLEVPEPVVPLLDPAKDMATEIGTNEEGYKQLEEFVYKLAEEKKDAFVPPLAEPFKVKTTDVYPIPAPNDKDVRRYGRFILCSTREENGSFKPIDPQILQWLQKGNSLKYGFTLYENYGLYYIGFEEAKQLASSQQIVDAVNRFQKTPVPASTVTTTATEIAAFKNPVPTGCPGVPTRKKVAGGLGIITAGDANNFIKMQLNIVKHIEGGYFHPLHFIGTDGELQSSGMGKSGETLWGLDRAHGKQEAKAPGRKLWALIDKYTGFGKYAEGYGNPSGKKVYLDAAFTAKDQQSKLKSLGINTSGLFSAKLKGWGHGDNPLDNQYKRYGNDPRKGKSSRSIPASQRVPENVVQEMMEHNKDLMKSAYDGFVKKNLAKYPGLMAIIESDGRLQFALYRSAAYNGPGSAWKWWKKVVAAWQAGETSPVALLCIELNSKIAFGNPSHPPFANDAYKVAGLTGVHDKTLPMKD